MSGTMPRTEMVLRKYFPKNKTIPRTVQLKSNSVSFTTKLGRLAVCCWWHNSIVECLSYKSKAQSLNPSIVKIVIIINKNLIKNLSPKESR
jgi:hypothetical protein